MCDSQLDIPDRNGHEALSPRSPHEEDRHTSDEEYQHALEVVFDPENTYRRKSSLVAVDTPACLTQRCKNTVCFVHSLLEEQRKQGIYQSGLDGIVETLGEQQISADKIALRSIDGVGGSGVDLAEGQSDEQKLRSQPSEPDSSQTHSRLLTKKQLSDMARGVRELSKRLSSIRLKLKVKNVFILTKSHDETLIEKTREVARWLLSDERKVRYIVYVEEKLRDNKKFNAKMLLEELEQGRKQKDGDGGGEVEKGKNARQLRYWNDEMCRSRPHTFDFVITLGGDGTVLYASWLFQHIVPPVLSFSLGSLGFLTKFDFNDFEETLARAFRDGVLVSLRLRFEGTVMRSQKKKAREALQNGGSVADSDRNEDEGPRDLVEELIGEEKDDERTHKPDQTYEILNDIVVDRGPNPTMSTIEVLGDDEYFTTVQADGVCVATPTGSTAYNLAAGGSLCHPENPVILVTAICAHSLSFRPIILPDTIVLRVGVPYDARTSSWASFDGRERLELCPGDYVTISASRYPFANVLQEGRRSEDWVKNISGKLGWNTRQRQKSYKEWD